jgi:hypothetical protein
VVCGVEIDAVLATVVALADDELCVGEITMDLVVLVTPGEEVLVSDRLLCPVTCSNVPVKVELVSDCVFVAGAPGPDCVCVMLSEVVPEVVNWPNAEVVPMVVPVVVPEVVPVVVAVLCVGEIAMALVVLVVSDDKVLVSDRLLCPVTSGIVPVTVALVSDCVVVLPVVVPVVLDQASAVTNEALTVADRVVVDSICGMVTEAVLVTDWLVVDLVCVGVSEIV